MKNRAYCVTAHAWHNENEKVKLTIIAKNKELAIAKFIERMRGLAGLWNVINVEEVLHEEH